MSRVRVIVVRLPPGVREEEARRVIEEALERLAARLSVEELRRRERDRLHW